MDKSLLIIFIALSIAILVMLYGIYDFFWGEQLSEVLPEPLITGLVLIDSNSLIGIAPIETTLTLTYPTLINCLIKYESGGNIYAIGKANECGILQFKRKTYQRYCTDKYGLGNNIFNPALQKICCDKMLQENFQNITHWSPYKLCLTP